MSKLRFEGEAPVGARLIHVPDPAHQNSNGHRGQVRLNEEQLRFVDALRDAARFFDSQGFSRDSWMVIAGGGVFLYQLATKGATVDRVPTDLDIIIHEKNARNGTPILELLRDRMQPHESSLRTEPIMHHGHLLTAAGLSTKARNGMPIDVTTELSQIYPPDHHFRPSMLYSYPPSDLILGSAIRLKHPLLPGQITTAHPGMIAFYKLIFKREKEGKQDIPDLQRLKRLGLLDPSPALEEVVSTMCLGDREFASAIRSAIRDL